MNNKILYLDSAELDPTIETSKRSSYYQRQAVRAVLTDSEGRVALMYSKVHDYYKLPGGGVDEGEDFETALRRELLEEVGAKIDIVSELGEVEEWRDFVSMRQQSFAYHAALVELVSDPDFTEEELAAGFEVKWLNNLDLAVAAIEDNFKHEDMSHRFMTTRDSAILKTMQQ